MSPFGDTVVDSDSEKKVSLLQERSDSTHVRLCPFQWRPSSRRLRPQYCRRL